MHDGGKGRRVSKDKPKYSRTETPFRQAEEGSSITADKREKRRSCPTPNRARVRKSTHELKPENEALASINEAKKEPQTRKQFFAKKRSMPLLALDSGGGGIGDSNKSAATGSNSPKEATKEIDKNERIWDKIIEFQQGNNTIVMPSDDEELRALLGKTVPRKAFIKFAQSNKILNFNTRYTLEIGDLTVSRILIDFPEILELLCVKQDGLGFVDQDIELFKKLYNIDNEFKGFRKDILELMSSKSKNASNYYLRHVDSMRKLLRYYTPANSEYVMKLIGAIKYKDIIANSIYMLTSVARFVLKQYSDELKENANRLEGTCQETESLLRLLVKRKIITCAAKGEFRTTADSQALIFVIFRVWRDVFKITNAPKTKDQKHDSNISSIKDIHPVKALDYTLSMFIALSRYMLDLKKKDPKFYYDSKFSDCISQGFATLIANNLRSRSITGEMFEAMGSTSANNSNSSVNARTFRYKLDSIYKLMDEALGVSINDQDVLEENDKYLENDERINEAIESVVEELTYGRKFVIDASFTRIYRVDIDGKFKVKKNQEGDVYNDNQDLTKVMNTISLAIASEAGIKINKTELKYLVIAKTLVTLLASYLLNTLVLKKWFSVPLQILINLHGIDYLSSYLQYYINLKEEQTKAEYNKYNEIDKEFNNTIEILFEQEAIYPILDGKYSIGHIYCIPGIKIYLGIIAAAFKSSEIDLDEVAPQDISALAKSMFNELCFYSIPEPNKKLTDFSLKKANIKQISEAFGSVMKASLEKKEGNSSYTPVNTPNEVSKILKDLLGAYMNNLREDPNIYESTETSSTSISFTSSSSTSLSSSSEIEKLKTPHQTDINRIIKTSSMEFGRIGKTSSMEFKPKNPIIELSTAAKEPLDSMESPRIIHTTPKSAVSRIWVNSIVSKPESSPRKSPTGLSSSG